MPLKGGAECAFCGGPISSGRDYCGHVCQVMAGCSGTTDPRGCWVWTRAKRENGYGLMRILVNGRYSMRSPHRVIYAAEYGEVPYTKSVLQTCGTKNCCNPRHLKLGVQEMELVGNPQERGTATQPEPAHAFEKVA